jgi:hypothetical protein
MVVVMGKHTQSGSGESLFSSKRFVVAACGAIAMVLGAMSVGAREGSHDDPVGTYPSPIAANQSIYIADDDGTSNGPAPMPSAKRTKRTYLPYIHQDTTVRIDDETAGNSGSSRVSRIADISLSLSLAPLTATVSVTPNQMFTPSVPLAVPQETPTVSESTVPTTNDTPLQGTTTTVNPVEPVDTPDPDPSPEMAAQ